MKFTDCHLQCSQEISRGRIADCLTKADEGGCAVERRDARKACSRGIPEPVTADVANRGTVRCLCRPRGASMLCAAPMRFPATSCASADACTCPLLGQGANNADWHRSSAEVCCERSRSEYEI